MLPGIAGNAGFVGENGGGAGGITFVGSTSYESAIGSGSVNVSLPGTPLENDIVLVACACDRIIVEGSDGGIATAADYTRIGAMGGHVPGWHYGYKIMGNTPDITVEILENASKKQATCVMVFRGVDTTTPLDGVTPAETTGSTNLPDGGSVTPNTDGAEVVVVGGLDDQKETSPSAPTGYSNLVSLATTDAAANANVTTMMASKNVETVAVEDPSAFTGSQSDDWVAVTISLRPA
ncbi:MAG: hypothetical protein GY743_09965 [Planctomycetaceae bacterium]|nr:hypothetical protein [Planctomycetaceae bacterium]